MTSTQAPTLRGQLVQLEQLSPEHATDLQCASADGEPWRLWYTSVPHLDDVEQEIQNRLAQQEAGKMVPFATRRLEDQRIIGMTSLYSFDWSVPTTYIGYTWNALSAQRTGTNIESKKLLLRYLFEERECISVYLETHKYNNQSRTAIGASLDGILRNHKRMPDGSIRDTAVYSIVRDEWGAVHSLLSRRLEKYL